MEYKYHYSASTNSFYPTSMMSEYENSEAGWPHDAIGITEEEYDYLFSKQGADDTVIAPDDGGRPVLKKVERPRPTPVDQRSELIKEADAIIQPLMGYALAGIMSDADKASFKTWNEYRKTLENIDVTADDIKWPDKPQ